MAARGRLGRRRALPHLGDHRPGRDAELVGDRLGEGGDADAEVGVLDRAAGDDLGTIEETVLDGMAKPMPSLPPDSLLICVLTPTTRPAAFRSGPPELPWLMAASVWIEFEIVKLFGRSSPG